MTGLSEAWVGTFHDPVPIRCRGTLHFYSCREARSGRLHVVVMAPRSTAGEGRARLSSLARAHRLLAGGDIPDVAAEGLDDTIPWVALDCDAVSDFESLTDFVTQGGERPLFAYSSVVGKTLMENLARCHALSDPESGAPMCLGSLAAGNLLLGSDGRIWIVGFGGGPLNGAVVAPEVDSGAPPTPGADVYALTVFLRSHIRFAGIPPVVRRVFSGTSIASDAKLVVLLVWSNLKILAGSPARRPSMEAAQKQARKMWRLLGIEPDVEGFRRWATGAVALEPDRLADVPARTPVILLGQDAQWLQTPNGMCHSLQTRRPLRRMLLALAEAHVGRAGAALSVDELLQASWPGEQPLPEARNNRVYVAISTLRKLGLGDMLQRWDGGYRLDPAVPCRIAGA